MNCLRFGLRQPYKAKKVCKYKNGCQLITAICAPHSTVTCMYRATSMNHTRLIFVKMNFNGYNLLLGIRLWAYLAYTMLLKNNVTYLLLCFVLFAKWRIAATIHPATTVLEHIVAI